LLSGRGWSGLPATQRAQERLNRTTAVRKAAESEVRPLRCQDVSFALGLPETHVKFRERNVKGDTGQYQLDDLLIDTGKRRVMRGGVDLGIAGLSFDLLLTMGRAAPNLLSADQLMESVWPGQVVSTETLTQRVKLLRHQLGDAVANPRYIVSRRGYGYRLVSPMVSLSTGKPERTYKDRAHELYLQARVVMRGTHASRDEALVLVDQALSEDPQFAQALAYRALLLAGSVRLSGMSPSRLAKAEQDAMQALAIDPDVSDAHVARALVCVEHRRWLEAEAHFGTARSIDPTDPFVRNLYALNILRPTGRLQQALKELTHTYQLAPADGFTAHELALTHSLLGDDSEALRFGDLARALSGIGEPHWDVLVVHARAAARKGQFAEAPLTPPRPCRQSFGIAVAGKASKPSIQHSVTPHGERMPSVHWSPWHPTWILLE
jgi:DNA-binding winged helix-turn-helix (wHTH) protein